ncbi:MAG: phosphoribosylformylglycinamidine synthase subunit PurQ [Thermoanaerobaculaceae bacterium]|jgi:phosphoribosylformylglycinamidine synthase|nr:phosphoribosylformylglycinamidine synthase subunit PurQ [Thermoanaerobaculaceae bacterium]
MTDGARRSRVAVVIFPGSNCDRDALGAVEAVGGEAVPVWHQSRDLQRCGAVILPGGFSYGDYLRAGAMAAHSPIMKAVRRHAEQGGAVLGICNGFQMLLEVGLLPGAMLMNRSLRFICRDVFLRVERTDLALLRTLSVGQVLRLPIAHKEGNWFADPAVVREVESGGAVAFRYCDAGGQVRPDANPNGALQGIAGLVNRDGNVLGMMPHPERRVARLLGGEDGRALVRALVEAA